MRGARQKEKKVGKAERAKERDGQMSWDPARCTPGRVELSPEKLIRDARVECSGWGYHATAMGSPPLDGEHRRYFEFKIDEGGWGCMMGLADASRYSLKDGAACDTEHAWVIYCNNGRYFRNKICTGESGAVLRAGDTLGVLFQIRDAEKPAHWHVKMGEVTGREGFLTFFRNGVQLPGGHINVATYETSEEKSAEKGTEYHTVATVPELVPVVDFYASAKLKLDRGTQQDTYIHHLMERAGGIMYHEKDLAYKL